MKSKVRKEQNDYILNNYGKVKTAEIAEHLGLTISVVSSRAYQMGISQSFGSQRKAWTEQELELLRNVADSGTAKEIQSLYFPDRTVLSVKGAMQRIRYPKSTNDYSKWTNEEIEKLKELYATTNNIELCKILNRPQNSIVSKARNLGLKKDFYFSDEEVQFIKDNYNKLSDHDIAKVVGHHWRVVKDKRLKMGLKHSDVILNTGYRDLAEFLRKKTENWRRESMAWCNYKCVITGKNFDVIHHLYGVNMIMQEVIEELDVPQNIDPNNYDEKELEKILALFDKKQSEYGLGICLTNEMHKMFHFEYGYGDNTPEQFEEFCKKHGFKLNVDITQN